MSWAAPGAATSAGAVWLRRLAPAEPPRVRLVCFPHAGGTAAFFRPWRAHLPAGVELLGVQYPGRLDRLGEPCVENVDQAVGPLATAVRSLLDRPVALFGHSLGATMAYEVARRVDGLAGLFVSGRPAPDRLRPVSDQLDSDDALWEELGRLGGTRPEVLANADLREALLPALRGDYRLVRTYRPRPGPPLDCPLTALVGDADSEVDLAEAGGWAAYTRGVFTLRTFPGGHFYLMSRTAELVDEILGRLARHLPAEPVTGAWP